MSHLIGQKLMGNGKIEKLKCDIFGDFQTLWIRYEHLESLFQKPGLFMRFL